jgi:hypothetical protein
MLYPYGGEFFDIKGCLQVANLFNLNFSVMSRKRIKRNGVMVAWSNGERIHLNSEQMKELDEEYGRKLDQMYGRYRGCRWSQRAEMLRVESGLKEEFSDRLWELDRHVQSLCYLMDAAVMLIDWDSVVLGPETNYYHPNLLLFRMLIGRCRERLEQDPTLKPLFKSSVALSLYEEMEAVYAGYKGLGWVV